MRNDTLKALEAFFQKTPMLKAGPVSRLEIENAFEHFPFGLSEDYLRFVEIYGGAIVGPYRIYGLRKAPPMGKKEGSALDVTERFVKQKWPSVENWLIISMDHSGNPIGLTSDGRVCISDHHTNQVSVIAASFEDFLRQWCLVDKP